MKKLCVLLLFGMAAYLVHTQTVSAVPAFGKRFAAKYAGKGAPAEFKAAVKKAKCNVCHVKGKPKKVRNEYGVALSKLLKKKDFTSAKVKADVEGTKKAMNAAFDKVGKTKNEAGKAWAEVFKAGSLPK